MAVLEGNLLFVGLGNPGEDYDNTYHNMGFMAMDTLADTLGKKVSKKECLGSLCVFSKNNENVVLLKPDTFMNNSGQSVKAVMAKYDVTASNVFIIYDDIDIPRFTVRARRNGSAGTHNGMKSVIAELSSSEFPRIRIGIGKEPGELVKFVLSKTVPTERAVFNEVFKKTAEVLAGFIADRDFDKLMRTINLIDFSGKV